MSKIPKRQWEQIQRLKENNHISTKNNNRVYCRNAHKAKYSYENELKAKVALRFNQENGAKRYYACDSCTGYHLTSKTIEEYLAKRDEHRKQ